MVNIGTTLKEKHVSGLKKNNLDALNMDLCLKTLKQLLIKPVVFVLTNIQIEIKLKNIMLQYKITMKLKIFAHFVQRLKNNNKIKKLYWIKLVLGYN